MRPTWLPQKALFRGIYLLVSVLCLLGIGIAPVEAFTETFHFSGFDDGELISRQLEERGVRFPFGVHVGTDSFGNKFVQPLNIDEFTSGRIVIEFTAPVKSVSLNVQKYGPTIGLGPGFAFSQDVRIMMTAYSVGPVTPFGFSFLMPDSGQVRVSHPLERRVLAVTHASSDIIRVVIHILENGIQNNLDLIANNLVIESDASPPSAAIDILSPSVGITQLDVVDTTLDDRPVRYTIRANDNNELRTVSYHVTDTDGNPVVPSDGGVSYACGGGGVSLCGTTFVTPSGSGFTVPSNGDYMLIAHACDWQGNCREARRRFTVTEPPPPVPVIPQFVEINQGVQGLLTTVVPIGTVVEGRSSTVLLAGKDTVLRWYLFGEGDERLGYVARMEVLIDYLDGTNRSFNLSLNTGPAGADVPSDPGTFNDRKTVAERQMRPNLTQTLNFVIPGSDLESANRLQVRLVGLPLSSLVSPVQFTISGRVVLGLHLIYTRDRRDGGTGPRPTREEVDGSILNYLKTAYPVSDVLVLGERNYDWMPGGVLNLRRHNSNRLLRRLWRNFGGDDAPGRYDGPYPIHTSVVGVVTEMPHKGCCGGGIAYRNPSRKDVAITTLFGDTAAQEIGHNLGFKHRSNAHGESGGGATEPSPFPHGTIGSKNFGMIPTFSPGFPAYSLTLVDPCSPASSDGTCTLTEPNQTHEFMSYGGTSASGLNPPFTTLRGRWTSYDTYNRIYNKISRKGGSSSNLSLGEVGSASVDLSIAGGTKTDRVRVEALLIDGEINDIDGSIELDPFLRKLLPKSMLEDAVTGQYTLEAYDAIDNLLMTQPFDIAAETHDDMGKVISVTIPYLEGIARVLIREGLTLVAEKEASPNKPIPDITEPKGGEIFESGIHAVRWEASDPDGDPLIHLVQYSPDGGVSWQGIAIVEEGDPLEAQFDVNELIPGRKGLIRITTSDGFNTEVSSTTVAFSVGTDLPPIIKGDLDEDGDVDRDDLKIILAARNTPATGPDDPRDLDGDGKISGLDARKLVLLCTRLRCAVN